MSSLSRTFCCLAAGFVSCYVGLIAAAIFVPLIVPQTLAYPDPSETWGLALMMATMLICALAGFAVCWKFTARWVKQSLTLVTCHKASQLM